MANKNNMPDNLKITHWNANGLMQKWSELKSYIDHNNIDVMLLNEIRTPQKYSYNLRGYSSYRLDRTGKHAGGGLLILVNNNIKHSPITLNHNFSTIEAIGVKIDKLAIFSIYARPEINKKVNVIDTTDLNKLMGCAPKVIALGDYNAKHQVWGCKTSNKSGRVIQKYTSSNQLTVVAPHQYTLYPTNGGQASTVDFAIVKNCNTISNIEAINDLDSDHLPVHLELGTTKDIRHEPKYMIDYKNADWQLFKSTINEKLTVNYRIKTKEEVDDTINMLQTIIINAKNQAIPNKLLRPDKSVLPDHIQELIRKRNRIRNIYQRTKVDIYRQQKNSLSNTITREIQTWNNDNWEKKLQNLNVKDNSIWKTAKSFTKKLDNKIPTLHGPNGLVFTDTEKANVLAENFEQVHHLTENDGDVETETLINNTYEEIINTCVDKDDVKLTTPHEIVKAIKKTKSKKAPGPDGIQNILLKNLPKKVIVQLMYVFNTCMLISYFPKIWKKANILAFPKPNKDKLFPQNYRPISLLPTLSKIFEIIILNRIKKFEGNNNIMREEQFGFRDKRSTIHQLSRITNYITTNFNLNKSTAMILLDIEKAFDTVWHRGLIYKLKLIGMPIHIIKLLQSYQIKRTFSVVVNGAASKLQTVVAGVPQGSILGPQLFSYYINDLPIDPNTNTALFAEDTAVYIASWNKNNAIKKLQKTLNGFMEYYNKWKIKINAAKTESIIFSHKKKLKRGENDLNITINNEVIKPKNNVKYLGVTLSNRLNHKLHISKACNKAYAIRNLLFPLINKKSKLSTKNKIILYKALIKPIILYAAPIWGNASKTLISKMQTVQNKILRVIANVGPEISNVKIKNKLNINDITNDIYMQTKKFYKTSVKQHKILNDIGALNKNNAPFQIKYKLPYSLLWDSPCK